MAAQDLTYNDIKSAIIEALSEHDSEVARYGSVDTKIRAETKDLTLKLLNEIKAGFKQDKDSDDKLIKEIKKAVNLQQQQAEEKEANNPSNTTQSFNNQNKFFDKLFKSADNKLGGFLSKLGASLKLVATSKIAGAAMAGATIWDAHSNEATQNAVNAMKALNTNGIAQDWAQFREGLKDSTISLETLTKAVQGHSQAFGALNKMTGNAVGTYQKLASQAQAYASREAGLAYDQEQTSEALNSYLEMQRATSNLDRLNEKEMQNGVNKLMKSADELAKEFGLSRDALLKNATADKDLSIALQGYGKTPDEIAEITTKLATMRDSGQTAAADAIEKLIKSGGTDRDALSQFAYLNSQTANQGVNQLLSGNIVEGINSIMSKQAASEMQASLRNMQGSTAGIMNIHGGDAVTGAMAMMQQAGVANQTRGGKAKTDTEKVLADEQNFRDREQQKANNRERMLMKSAEGASKMLNMLAAEANFTSKIFRSLGDAAVELNKATKGYSGSFGGFLSGLLHYLGDFAALFITYKTFFGGGRGGFGFGRNRGLAGASKTRVKALRGAANAGLHGKQSRKAIRNKKRSLRGGRGRGILGAGAAILGGIGISSLFGGSAEADEYDEGAGVADTAADVADVADMADSKAPKEAKKASTQKPAEAPKPKKKSWLGRMKDKVKNVATKGWKKLGKAGKWLGKAGKWVGKIGAKVGKFALKKIPGLSLVGGAIFAAQRALAGDWTGALGELASGAAACIPGAGTAISCAIDAGMMARDVAKEAQQVTDEAQANQETIAEATAENQQSIEEAKAQIEETKAKVEENTETSSDTTDTQDATKEYTELTSQIAGNSLETNQILEKILIAIENNNRTNI